jgi:hypothetical protein
MGDLKQDSKKQCQDEEPMAGVGKFPKKKKRIQSQQNSLFLTW